MHIWKVEKNDSKPGSQKFNFCVKCGIQKKKRTTSVEISSNRPPYFTRVKSYSTVFIIKGNVLESDPGCINDHYINNSK